MITEAQGFASSGAGQAIIGAVLALVVKYSWDRWLSKTSRVTQEECLEHQRLCAGLRNLNLAKLLGVHDAQIRNGDQEFSCIGTQLEKISTILEAVLDINLKLCRINPEIDCDDLLRVLAKKGLEINVPGLRDKTKT